MDAYFPNHRLIVELDGWGDPPLQGSLPGDRRQDFAILAATGIPTVRLPYEDVGDAIIAQLRDVLSLVS